MAEANPLGLARTSATEERCGLDGEILEMMRRVVQFHKANVGRCYQITANEKFFDFEIGEQDALDENELTEYIINNAGEEASGVSIYTYSLTDPGVREIAVPTVPAFTHPVTYVTLATETATTDDEYDDNRLLIMLSLLRAITPGDRERDCMQDYRGERRPRVTWCLQYYFENMPSRSASYA